MLKVIGENVLRNDAEMKVTGQAKFAADYMAENMLYAKVFRSKVPHALIKKLDISKAQALPGVVKILTYKDIPGQRYVGIIRKDQPVLVEDKIRYVGDAIALVAADTLEIAEEALNLIDLELEVLPAVSDPFEAMKEDSIKVHGESNILENKYLIKGDVDAVFDKCDVIIENKYHTQMTSHMFIEPEAALAKYEDGKLDIWVSTQNTHFDRNEISRVLGIPLNKVRVIQAITGGGFGGKLDISTQCHTSLLAYTTKRPVKLVYSREESTKTSSKRHPYYITYKTGADKNGKVLAIDVRLVADTGAYASYGPGVLTRGMVHMTGPYEVPNVRVHGTLVHTNNPMAGAMRGFGVPQVAVAHETQLEMLAERLGISPWEIRKRNSLVPGSFTGTNQQINHSVGIIKTLDGAKQKCDEIGWEIPSKPSDKPDKAHEDSQKSHLKRGRGIGCMWYGIGNTGLPNPAGAFVEMHMDGTVTVLTGAADIGQGSDTVMGQIVAEVLGVGFDDVLVRSADTGVTPESGASSASRQTYISGNACKKAAEMARETIYEVASNLLGNISKNSVVLQDKMAYDRDNKDHAISLMEILAECGKRGILIVGSGYFNPDTTYLDPKTMAGRPYATYAFATQVVEVEINTRTGEIKLLEVVAAHDLGKAINRKMVTAQIEGGVVMGAGYALLEEIELKNSQMLNPNFSKYLMMTARDIPTIHPVIIEDIEPTGPFGAKGVGEPALIPTPPAIINAVYDAIGVRLYELPVTQEKIIKALKNSKEV